MRYKFLTAFLLLIYSFSTGQPITGEAKNLIFKEDRIIYEGNARLTRGEAELKADRVIIMLGKKGKPKRLIAEGSVRYIEPGRSATAEYAEYDLEEEVIVLRGKAVVEEDKNVLEADEIVYDRKNKTLQAKGETRRVRTIYIEEEHR